MESGVKISVGGQDEKRKQREGEKEQKVKIEERTKLNMVTQDRWPASDMVSDRDLREQR